MKGQQERSRECLLWPSFLHFFSPPFQQQQQQQRGE